LVQWKHQIHYEQVLVLADTQATVPKVLHLAELVPRLAAVERLVLRRGAAA
jgi:hypothetical protein